MEETIWSSLNWIKTVLDDIKSHKLMLTEAGNMAQNSPLWRLLAIRGTLHYTCGARQK